jgi:hypothetical protein
MYHYTKLMNSKLFLMAVVVIAAFGITAAVGPVTIATPALAQNMTDMGGNMTGGNMTAGNMTGNMTG